MTPITLGARASNAPHPTGRPTNHPRDNGGTIAFPAAQSWINVAAGIGQRGPFNLPTRFWLVAGANCIIYPPSSPDWNRYDLQIRLLQGSVGYVNDLNGQQFHQNADSMPGGGYFADWMGNNLEARFYCEANIDYYVRLLTQGGGAGNSYYQSSNHIGFWAYTVGEGVY